VALLAQGRPGSQGGETTTNDTESLVTVTDAIRVAGGIKPRANVREILIRRIHRSGEERLFEVNLWDMLQAGDLTQDAVLQSGDTIIVPVATGEIAPAELNQIAEASFAPDTITVNVVGEVNEAGAVSIPPNTSLNQGILAAGGFNVRAREDRVLLVRLNPDGTVTHQEIEVDFTQGLDTERNPILMNNDVIIVGESGIASFADSIGAIARPIADIFSIFSAPLRTINLVD
jgi:polysaccharide export outer membrane protein